MQSQYGTDKVKAILQFAMDGSVAGRPVLKSALNCTLIGSPTGTVVVNGVVTTLATLPGGNSNGRYLVQLADGPVTVAGAAASGDNDNNTAIVVGQSGNGNPCQEYWVQFGPQASTTPGSYTVNAGTIEIDFGGAGGTSPAEGALITVIFHSCYDGANNTP